MEGSTPSVKTSFKVPPSWTSVTLHDLDSRWSAYYSGVMLAGCV